MYIAIASYIHKMLAIAMDSKLSYPTMLALIGALIWWSVYKVDCEIEHMQFAQQQ